MTHDMRTKARLGGSEAHNLTEHEDSVSLCLESRQEVVEQRELSRISDQFGKVGYLPKV
jgi:hypothetical protein